MSLQPQGGVEPAPPVGFRLQCRFLECHDSMLDVAEQPLRHAAVKADAVDAGRSDDLAETGNLHAASPRARASLHPFELPHHLLPPSLPILGSTPSAPSPQP